MNKIQIEKFNSVITDEDEVWILGDLVLGDIDGGLELLKQLKGKIHVCLGNHDTGKREQIYRDMGWDVQLCAKLKYKKYNFYLSHYPTITHDLEEKKLWQQIWNLCGHLHITDPYYQMKQGFPIYHIEVDAHNGYPVSLDEIIEQIKIFKDKND